VVTLMPAIAVVELLVEDITVSEPLSFLINSIL
jgi:hypothetical protein